MRDSPTEPSAADDLRGSVAQTLFDLGEVAGRLPEAGSAPAGTARVLARLSRELAEAAVMAGPPVPFTDVPGLLGAVAVRGLLRAVATALDIPAPATAEDEITFLRLRSERATEALRAILRVLAHADRTDMDLAWEAVALDEALDLYPADRYEHSAMSS